jgi:hypothetical protein
MNPNTTNNFYGQKLSKLGINVANAADNQLLWKDDYDNDVKTWYGTSGPVMEQGTLPNGGYGLYIPDINDGEIALKVAQPGIEVSTAANDQLVFNSNQDMFKIILSGNGSIPASVSNNSTLTVAHNLGFIPALIGYVDLSSIYYPFPLLGINGTSGAILSLYQCSVDSTNAYFTVQTPGSTVSTATSIKYYLLQESAN